MKNYLLLLLTFFGAVSASGQDNFTGNWQNEDESIVVQIYTTNSEYYAKVIASKNPEDIEKIVLIQMEKKSKTRLFGGTYYDFELKSEYEAQLRLIDPNTIRMKILSGFFKKTIFWHRVEFINKEQPDQFTVLQY